MDHQLDVEAYLDRIDYAGPREPTLETLRNLHRAHLIAVPFENLDISLGRPIVLDIPRLEEKIVRRRRGGFCYELNGLFSELLRALGFQVTLLSSRVARATGGFGPEFDHLLLRVDLDDDRPGAWLADVGFGDSFMDPLSLAEGIQEERDGSRAFRLDRDGDAFTLLNLEDGDWVAQHRFTLTPRAFPDYADMCVYHQTSEASSFTRGRVCTLATPAGRVTLRDDRLIITTNGERETRPIADLDAFHVALREHFGITLDDAAPGA